MYLEFSSVFRESVAEDRNLQGSFQKMKCSQMWAFHFPKCPISFLSCDTHQASWENTRLSFLGFMMSTEYLFALLLATQVICLDNLPWWNMPWRWLWEWRSYVPNAAGALVARTPIHMKKTQIDEHQDSWIPSCIDQSTWLCIMGISTQVCYEIEKLLTFWSLRTQTGTEELKPNLKFHVIAKQHLYCTHIHLHFVLAGWENILALPAISTGKKGS